MAARLTKTVKIYCDGGARGNPGPAAAAFVVVGEGGKVLFKRGFFLGQATNNVAEYEAVARAFWWLSRNDRVGQVHFFVDSQLVANQLTGKFKIRQERLRQIAARIKNWETKISGKVTYQTISRNRNKIADFLVNQTLDAVKAKRRLQ